MKKLTICMFGMLLYTFWAPTILHAQTMSRLSAQFRRWDGGEDFTTVTPGSGGTNIYTRTVTVPPGRNVLYITYAAVGDTHSFSGVVNSMQHLCLVDGLPCNSGFSASSGFTGWLVTQKTCDNGGCGTPSGGDRHDNSLMYEWCANIPQVSFATVHTVAINMASTTGLDDVFNEGAHIFIDTNHVGGGCTKSTTPAAPATKQTTH